MPDHEPPMLHQRKRHMLPGEDAPDCAHCGAGLHEARPRLSDALYAVSWCETTKMLYGKIAVDCPSCAKPNEVVWHIDMDNHTWSAAALSMWTYADERYALMMGMKTHVPVKLVPDKEGGA